MDKGISFKEANRRQGKNYISVKLMKWSGLGENQEH
jgi:hypothetical protein